MHAHSNAVSRRKWILATTAAMVVMGHAVLNTSFEMPTALLLTGRNRVTWFAIHGLAAVLAFALVGGPDMAFIQTRQGPGPMLVFLL